MCIWRMFYCMSVVETRGMWECVLCIGSGEVCCVFVQEV